MLLSVCLSVLLVSAMSMPMDVEDEDIIERSPRESFPTQAIAKELEKEEAVLLGGRLLNELSKELKAQQAVKSREADDTLAEENDLYEDDVKDRSLDEDVEGDEEEREAEKEEDQTAEALEERWVKGRRSRLLRRLRKHFKKLNSHKNERLYSGTGGYSQALKNFWQFKPKNVTEKKGKWSGNIGKGRISLKVKGKSKRPTLIVVRKGRVYKFMY